MGTTHSHNHDHDQCHSHEAHQHQHNHPLGHHHHHHRHGAVSNIRLAFALNFCFAILELVGGLYTGSVAILSDALHDFGDSLSLGLALFLEKAAARGSTAKFSYGFRRLSLLSAVVTATILLVGSAFVLGMAIPRLWEPVLPRVNEMIILAIIGVAVNGYAAWRVSFGETMNEKVISWHLVEDVMGWVLVLVTSIVMKFTELAILDPILSILFTVIIFVGVFKTLRSTLYLFLQGVPGSVDMSKLRLQVLNVPGVVGVHDMHAWSLDGEKHVMTLHAVVNADLSLSQLEGTKKSIKGIVGAAGKIHVTVEIEIADENCPDLNCVQDHLPD